MIKISELRERNNRIGVTFLDYFGYVDFEKLQSIIEKKWSPDETKEIKSEHSWYNSVMECILEKDDLVILLYLADTDDISLILHSTNDQVNIEKFKEVLKIITEE